MAAPMVVAQTQLCRCGQPGSVIWGGCACLVWAMSVAYGAERTSPRKKAIDAPEATTSVENHWGRRGGVCHGARAFDLSGCVRGYRGGRALGPDEAGDGVGSLFELGFGFWAAGFGCVEDAVLEVIVE